MDDAHLILVCFFIVVSKSWETKVNAVNKSWKPKVNSILAVQSLLPWATVSCIFFHKEINFHCKTSCVFLPLFTPIQYINTNRKNVF